MDLSNFNKPDRHIQMSSKDEKNVFNSIANLEKSNLDTSELFKIFDDWQSKRTLTTKKILVSTSILVTLATWVGADFSKLSFFGLEVSDGSPIKFIVFIIAVIILSGSVFYFSRSIDVLIREAKISHISNDVKSLHIHVVLLKKIINNNNIKSFSTLFYDFTSNTNSLNNNAIQVYNAIQFYYVHLSSPKKRLSFLSVFELIIIYGLGIYSIFVLATVLWVKFNHC